MRTSISYYAVAAVFILIVSGLSWAVDAGTIQVRGKTIRVGDTADYVFDILTKDEMISQDVQPDPNNPRSLLVTKNFKADGQSFTIAFARAVDSSPYVVVRITTDHAKLDPASTKLTIAAFERSSFLKQHKPTEKNKWTLESGGMNYSYLFPDPENSYSSIGVELSSDPNDLRKFGIEWVGDSTLEPAVFTSTKERFLREFLATALPRISADSVVTCVRSEGRKNYPGGGNAMPRKNISGTRVHTGVCGSSLIVGFEK